MITIAIVTAMCALRIALMWHPIVYSRADETSILLSSSHLAVRGWRWYLAFAREYARTPAMWQAPGPLRVGSIAAGSVATRLGGGYDALAWMSTIASCVVVAAVGWRYGAATALLVGACPLLLGLGRRALSDVPALAWQVLALTVSPWLAPIALLWKESSLLAVPAVWVSLGLWGGLPLAFGGAVWLAVTWYLIGEPPWRFFARVRRTCKEPTDDYNRYLIHGGPHRLLVDLVLCSPVTTCAALYLCSWQALLPAGVALLTFGVFMLQDIRIAVIIDIMLRIALAAVAPWWLLPIAVAVDVSVWYRAWWRHDLYAPVTAWLLRPLKMG